MTRQRKEIWKKIEAVEREQMDDIFSVLGFCSRDFGLPEGMPDVYTERREALVEKLAETYHMTLDAYHEMQYRWSMELYYRNVRPFN